MNIIHLSDTHTHEKRIKIIPCDILIHTGDFCDINFNEKVSDRLQSTFIQALEFLNWVDDYPARYKIITSGNHELFLNLPDLRSIFEKICLGKNIIFKDEIKELIEIEGLKIAGAGSYPHIAKYMTQKQAYEPHSGYYTSLPESSIDILLSHVPPQVSGNQFECEDLEYWLRERINDSNPIPLVLCGHIHESKGSYKIKGVTKVLNASCDVNPKLITV